MKIVYLTAGAAGMYCGSCMHDNTLAKAIAEKGVDIQLVPTYTPIRTDENDVSVDQVFFGGINVYLQQKMPFLRFLPKLFDRFLDSPWLIRRVTKNASKISPSELGKLAVSMLKGEKGNQRKEVKRLCKWMSSNAKPSVVLFSNILIGGCIPSIKESLDAKTIVTLQGDDIFLDSLPDKFKNQCIEQIHRLVPFVDRFLSHSHFYADYMSEFLAIPRNLIEVTPLGIDLADFGHERNRQPPIESARPLTIGFLARLAPEKGLDVLVDAFVKLKKQNLINENVKLKIAGWLGPTNVDYAETQFKKLTDAGLESEFEYLGSIDRDEKIHFLHSIDVLSVPTVYKEPKGLFVLEAFAAGVPVIQPNHGAFPEVLSDTNGGILFEPGNSSELANKLADVLRDKTLRTKLGTNGFQSVSDHRSASSMAETTLKIISSL